MKTKALKETNPYLKDAVKRKELIAKSVRTSCGVEGIKPKKASALCIKISHSKNKRIYKTAK